MLSYLNQDPSFKKIMENYLQDFTIVKQYLPAGDEYIIPIIAMCVQGMDDLLEEHVQKAVNQNVTEEKILEIIYQLEPIIGLPKVIRALTVIHRVIPELEIDVLNDNQESLMRESLYGRELTRFVQGLPSEVATFLSKQFENHMFTDYYQRSHLSIKERERYLFTAMVVLNIDFQITVRARGSLLAGNTAEDLMWSVVALLPYIGFPLVMNTVQQIHQVNEAWEMERKK